MPDIQRETVSEFHTGDGEALARHRAARTPIYKSITIKCVDAEGAAITSGAGSFTLAEGESVTLEIDRAPDVSGEIRFIFC